MSTSLSKKDIEEIKPYIDRTVQKFLGFSEPSLVTAALNCLNSGYDKRKTTNKLASLLDEKKAARLTERIFDLADELKSAQRSSRKRHHDSDSKQEERESSKKSKMKQNKMMANAQKMIEERKRALNALRVDEPPSRFMMRNEEGSGSRPNLYGVPASQVPSLIQRGDPDKARKIAQLQDKPTPLILDDEGRTVDITGKEVQLTHVVPTLKANIRAKKREEFRQQLQEKVVEDLSETHFFDPRIGMKSAAQLEKLQNEISQIARKTGITSATKLALIAPKAEHHEEEIPDVEWWDSVVLTGDSYIVEDGKVNLKESAVTNLVEHPIQMRPPSKYFKLVLFSLNKFYVKNLNLAQFLKHSFPIHCNNNFLSQQMTALHHLSKWLTSINLFLFLIAEPLKPVYMPVFLTKKERKKLRRQNRREAWKEEQEKIRLGLEPPPEPKLRISNLMRVLGTEAVQDPTKIEAHVREQMAKRQKAHEEANAARRLTADQRRDKKVRKLKEDTTLGVCVSVYR
ncbi:U4/U6 small nuclear ribonucleoprotein Prp3 [Blattella germanica]|nr:U4/U6 small nuclear ribonucleoprotein Prp3 [Blattella germanica]